MKVLLSLKPDYANQILAGTKKYEFRRRIFRNPNASDIVMYVTKPVGHVVGEFKIKQIHQGHPDVLWSLTEPHAGISREKFEAYFEGRSEGFAIEISEVVTYDHPMQISEVIKSGKPPQSFAYLEAGEGKSCSPPPRIMVDHTHSRPGIRHAFSRWVSEILT